MYTGNEFLLLTHWGQGMYLCISKLTIIGSENGLLPGRHQTIICAKAGILLIGPLGKNFSEISIEIYIFFIQENSFENVVRKLVANPWASIPIVLSPFCPLWVTGGASAAVLLVKDDTLVLQSLWSLKGSTKAAALLKWRMNVSKGSQVIHHAYHVTDNKNNKTHFCRWLATHLFILR